MLHLLVADGNDRAGRESHLTVCDKTSAETYAGILTTLAPDARCHLVAPADADAVLPRALRDCDALVLTGSSLHVEDGGPAVTRQCDLVRTALDLGVPVFGSCWGVQVAATIAGGRAARNPRGPEYGLARAISRTQGGAGHPLLEGRPPAWDAPAIHDDAVIEPPPGSRVLAGNDRLDVQAIEIRVGDGVFWGTQYHPELDLDEVAAMLRLSSEGVVEAGLCGDEAALHAYADALRDLHRDPDVRPDLAWRLGVTAEVLVPDRRRREIRNFLDRVVRPRRERG